MFYRTQEGEIFAVDVRENGASIELGVPHLLFKTSSVAGSQGPYSVSADGKKFLINAVPQQAEAEPLTLITNWTADLAK